MNEFEEKLLAYRSQEKRKERIETVKRIVLKPFALLTDRNEEESENEPKCTDQSVISISESTNSSVESDVEYAEEIEDEVPDKSINWIKAATYFIVWCGLFRYAVYVEFGAVFFLLSGFYFIWTNTRTGPKRRNELSAYSVFNPNCERIEGTVDAEQLQREMMFGFVS